MTTPSSNRDTLWPFNELETLCLALIVMTFVMFVAGYQTGKAETEERLARPRPTVSVHTCRYRDVRNEPVRTIVGARFLGEPR